MAENAPAITLAQGVVPIKVDAQELDRFLEQLPGKMKAAGEELARPILEAVEKMDDAVERLSDAARQVQVRGEGDRSATQPMQSAAFQSEVTDLLRQILDLMSIQSQAQ